MKDIKQLKSKFKIDELALVFIVVVLAFVVSLYERTDDSTIDAERITEMILDDHDISFVINGVVNENKLREIQKIDYVTLKNELKAKNDFCLYIEDSDGNVIVAKGSSKLNSEISHCKE